MLPLTSAIVLAFYALNGGSNLLSHLPTIFYRQRKALKQRILITGENATTTLAFARLASSAGYDVFLAENKSPTLLDSVSRSNAIRKIIGPPSDEISSQVRRIKAGVSRLSSYTPISVRFQQKPRPRSIDFSETILRTVQQENISLWIPCDSTNDRVVTQAKEAISKRTACRTFGPSAEVTKLSKDYSAFSSFVSQLGHNVKTPKAIDVSSRAEIHKTLQSAELGEKFRLEKKEDRRQSGLSEATLVEDDSPRSNIDDRVLPMSSQNETYSAVATMAISRDHPWILHEMLFGKQITVSSLVFNNTVRAFMAQISSKDRDFHFTGQDSTGGGGSDSCSHLNPKSTLARNLMDFTRKFAAQLPSDTTTHLNLQFILLETSTPAGVVQSLRATNCTFQASSLLAQYARSAIPSRSSKKLLLSDGKGETLLLPKSSDLIRGTGLYSLPVEVRKMLLVPAGNLVLLRGSSTELAKGMAMFWERLAYWQEDVFDRNDVWPWIWLWLVAAPLTYLLDSALFWRSRSS